MLLADGGYDADWITELAMKKGAWATFTGVRVSRSMKTSVLQQLLSRSPN